MTNQVLRLPGAAVIIESEPAEMNGAQSIFNGGCFSSRNSVRGFQAMALPVGAEPATLARPSWSSLNHLRRT